MSVLREEAAFHGETLGATQFLHVLNAAQKSYKLWHLPLKFYSIKIFQMISSTNDFQILVNKHMLGWFVVFLQNSHIKYVFSTFFRFMSVFFCFVNTKHVWISFYTSLCCKLGGAAFDSTNHSLFTMWRRRKCLFSAFPDWPRPGEGSCCVLPLNSVNTLFDQSSYLFCCLSSCP